MGKKTVGFFKCWHIVLLLFLMHFILGHMLLCFFFCVCVFFVFFFCKNHRKGLDDQLERILFFFFFLSFFFKQWAKASNLLQGEIIKRVQIPPSSRWSFITCISSLLTTIQSKDQYPMNYRLCEVILPCSVENCLFWQVLKSTNSKDFRFLYIAMISKR